MIAETYVYDTQHPPALVRLVLDNDLNSRADVERHFTETRYTIRELKQFANEHSLYIHQGFKKDMIIHRIIQHVIEIIFGEKHF